MNDVEQIIKDYYDKKKIQDKLKYEIDILKKNNSNLEEYIRVMNSRKDFIVARIEENNEKILDKQLKVNDISEENSNIEFILNFFLDDTEKQIIELRYKKNKQYQAMVDIVNMSKSTISRRVNKIIEKLEDYIYSCEQV
ncbi:sigma factor-like helix-turn-helix DNA-binding protein [Clostridium hydrogeniformans]|uniref:sigma factor-like helix-turn-helix DNA-binding protein n=1 Tax=Clostridium hydrogeniformans TaxID=349933 RepID=UPI00048806C4|nr:sigma-70 family RNA polymerase sigma factor [Clostridium hydrogeniformans]